MLQTTLVTNYPNMCIKTETIFLHSVSKTSQYSPNNPTSNCPPQLGNLKLLSGSLLSVVPLSEVITMSYWTCGVWLVWARGSLKYRILRQTFTLEGKRITMTFTGMGKPYLKKLRFTEKCWRFSDWGERQHFKRVIIYQWKMKKYLGRCSPSSNLLVQSSPTLCKG